MQLVKYTATVLQLYQVSPNVSLPKEVIFLEDGPGGVGGFLVSTDSLVVPEV